MLLMLLYFESFACALLFYTPGLHPALVAILFEIDRLKKPPLIFTEIHPPPLKNSKKTFDRIILVVISLAGRLCLAKNND